MDDHELTRRWALVTEHRDQALRVALARTRNRADAEDLVHEAMIKAVSVEELREETAGGLLNTIVIRLALDLHRRTATHRRFETVLSAEPTGTVDERVTDEAEAAWLAGQLIHLPVREREVLLHRAAGHSNASTAAVLGLTYKSVESAFTRARGHMQLVWRATAAIVLGIVAAARKVAPRPETALATATLAASVFAIAVYESSPDQGVPNTATGVFVTSDHATTTAAAAAPAAPPALTPAATSPSRQSATSAPDPSPTPGPKETTVITTPPLGEEGGDSLFYVTAGGVTLDGRGAQQSVEDCMKYGVNLDLSSERRGCNAATDNYDHNHPSPSPTPKAS